MKEFIWHTCNVEVPMRSVGWRLAVPQMEAEAVEDTGDFLRVVLSQ